MAKAKKIMPLNLDGPEFQGARHLLTGEPVWSVVEIIKVLIDAKTRRAATLYWSKLKQRLIAEGSTIFPKSDIATVEVLTNCQHLNADTATAEVVTNCHHLENANSPEPDTYRDESGKFCYHKVFQLKMTGHDGKKRLTDVADRETMFRIIESVPSPKAEPVKQWLAHLGAEHVEDEANPSRYYEKGHRAYKRKGMSEEWIAQRDKGIDERHSLTDAWAIHGITEGRQYGQLTNIITKSCFGMDTQEYSQFKGLGKHESLRDNMSRLELLTNTVAESATRDIIQTEQPMTFSEHKGIANRGGSLGQRFMQLYEAETGKRIVTRQNARDFAALNTGNPKALS